MGGSFGGMMWRIANSMGMGGYSESYSHPRSRTWAEITLASTEDELEKIMRKREQRRDDAIENFREDLKENAHVLCASGLVKKDDTLHKILCRAAGVKYRKPKTRKSR
jgi:hypothetical protein